MDGERIFKNNNYSSESNEGYGYSYEYGMKPILGFNAQVAYEFNVRERFAIVPGLKLSTKGYQLQYQEDYSEPNYSESYTQTQTAKTQYLDIPVNFKFNITTGKAKLYANVGVYYGIAMFGNYSYRSETETSDGYRYSQEENSSINEYFDSALDRMNAGANIGVGVEYKQFFLESNYNAGLTSFNTDDFVMINHYVGLSIGYKIRTKSK